MKRYCITLIIITLNLSCKRENPTCTPFFNYDAAIHYHLDEDGKMIELMGQESNSKEEEMLLDIFDGNIPPSSDNYKKYISDIERAGYRKILLDKTKYSKLDSTFCTRHPSELIGTTCIPEYRDIIIFMKSDTVSGIAKICFECGQWDIVGAVISPENFGQSGEFEMLHKLLK